MVRRIDGKDLLALWQETIDQDEDFLEVLVREIPQVLVEAGGRNEPLGSPLSRHDVGP